MRTARRKTSPWRPVTLALCSAVVLAGAALGLTQCFQPDLPACSYRCNATEPRCPDEYECRSDGYCHLQGNTEACPYQMNLNPSAVPDMTRITD